MRSRELSGFRAVGPLWVLLCCTTPRIVLGSLFSWAPRPPGAAAGPSGPRRARSPCIEVAHGKRFLKPRGVHGRRTEYRDRRHNRIRIV